MRALVFAAVLLLNLPELWHGLIGLDVWAADQIAQGLLVAMLGGYAWRVNRPVAALALIFGLARSSCVAVWPMASDAAGAICDAQIGLPITVGVVGAALIVAGRISSE